MTSLIKVDSIQTSSGGTPTASSLGISGTIGQVISTTKTDVFSTTSTSFTDVTGLSLTITPTSTSSKIYISSSLMPSTSTSGIFQFMRLLRDSTPISIGDSASNRLQVSVYSYNSYSPNQMGSSVTYLDSPATLSAVTYKFQMLVHTGTGYLNRDGDDVDTSIRGRSASTITAMEVLA